MSSKVLPIWKKDKIVFNNIGLPSSLRMMIVGPSGSGKTILLLKLLLYNLDFTHLVICSPSLDKQTEYQIFINALSKGLDLAQVASIFENQDEIDNVDELINDLSNNNNDIHVTIYRSPDELPEPEKLTIKKAKTLVIIDDCMLKRQNNIENLFVYGRPLGINTIYLTQSYFATDKQSIRGNCNAFIFFEVSTTDLRNSYEQIGTRDFDKIDDYKLYATEAWKSVDRGYFVVDMTKKVGNRFSANSL